MLCFAKFMEGTLFEGSIVAWMIGIPFIVLIVLTNRDHRVDLLLINVNKFQSGEDLQNQIRFILKLINWQATNKNAAILLDGYVEIHKQTCNKDDCPLKQKNIKSNIMNKNLNFHADDILNEKYGLLIQLLNKMYFYGIKKFPNNTSLRISYSFFLIEKLHMKQQALHELNGSEQNKPPFDEQFIIFRYRKIIEDEIAESKNEGTGNLDVVSEIAFQNHQRQCHANIEKSSMHHMEFWSQLSEDNPDLAKLNEIGSKIHHSVNSVEEHWNKLQKISPNMPKAMKLYGRFQTEIINDKEAGEEYLERARNLITINNHKKISMINYTGNEDIGDSSTPTIYVSGDPDKLGIITAINLACSSVFGYNKSELINRNIKLLMPTIYAKYHDQFLLDYITNEGKPNWGKAMNKERVIFGKHKSYYIFPIIISLKAIQNNYQSLQFSGTFRMDRFFKIISYMIVYNEGMIDSISSSCINQLKIDAKMITKRLKINDFFPGIFDEKENYMTKVGAVITYRYPKDISEANDKSDIDQVQEGMALNCSVTPLVFPNIEQPAYIFRFEKATDKLNNNIGGRKHKPCTFQFRFDKNKGAVIGEFTDNLVDDLLSDAEYNPTIGSNMISNLMGDGQPQNIITNEVNPELYQKAKHFYSVGIKTQRLVDGRPTEIQDNDSDEESEDDSNDGKKEKGSSVRGNSVEDEVEGDVDDFSLKMFNSTFKSRKQLAAIVKNNRWPKPVFKLCILGHFVLLALLGLAFINFFLVNSEFNAIEENIRLIGFSYRGTAELENIVSKVRDLTMLNTGINTYNTTKYTAAQIEGLWKANISASISEIEAIQKDLQVENIWISQSEPHIDLLTTDVVEMTHYEGQITSFDLNESTKQIIAKAFNIKEMDLTSFSYTNSDIFFITYNSFNAYYEALVLSSNYYVDELSDRCDNITNFLMILGVSMFVIIFGVISFWCVLVEVNKMREAILILFLDIPERSVKMLYTKCENFISNLQVGEDEDAISEIDEHSFYNEDDDENDEQADFNMRKRKKKSKNSNKQNRWIIPIIIISASIIASLFWLIYLFSYFILSDTQQLLSEINATSAAESYFYYVSNSQNELNINNVQTILQQNPNTVVNANINNIFELDSTIHEVNLTNKKKIATQYQY